ncbi:unnamed protein product [Enterobius vermicularis]|uniref:Uncharacterized protein n=1 Tax=Enterobius vermicularis TaxID=51028 RepID=A0A0N4V0T8_ENTVE|nr:unnamed protein product [Enterobius vermicularis]
MFSESVELRNDDWWSMIVNPQISAAAQWQTVAVVVCGQLSSTTMEHIDERTMATFCQQQKSTDNTEILFGS